MSSRLTLPLRLVQCEWGNAGVPSGTAATSPVLTPYKPSGLPCYAASQVHAASTATGGSGSSSSHSSAGTNASDGRRLFAVHTRHAGTPPQAQTSTASLSELNAPVVEAGAQPRPEDPSDSLLSRVVDTALPGCRPYVALPVLSSLLRHGASHTAAPPAALLNQWTARHKGLVLVTQSPSDALFLRNAAQLDLVQQTYRVLCRLPPGVAAAVRRYLHAHNTTTPAASDRVSPARTPRGNASGGAAALNPYLRAHAERQHAAVASVDLAHGIPLTASSAVGPLLPPTVHPHPLVSGGFFDAARGRLRVQGAVKCFLRVQTPLHPASQRKVEQFTRLQNLFTAPPASGRAHRNKAEEEGVSGATVGEGVRAGKFYENAHPWLQPEWRIGVSLDAPNMQSLSMSLFDEDDEHAGGESPHASHSTRTAAPRGKSLAFDFRLLSLSTEAESDLALYEVHTRGDATADEVAAVFQAEGLAVVNDYVQDTALASSIAEVARRMRAAPPGLLSSLPLGVQHYLRTASAEELVALPLTLVPLEDADRLCLQQVLHRHDRYAESAHEHDALAYSPSSSVDYTEEDLQRMRHYVQSALGTNSGGSGAGGGGGRHPLQSLLWHALSSLHLANAEERRVYEEVLTLTMGSGIECAALAFPDPSNGPTVHAMQQVWLTFEQQRQRHASLAEAARAARQHPSTAELRYVRRGVMDDPVGLTRVPLLEDALQSSPDRRRAVGRGECSFSQAVALRLSLEVQETSPQTSRVVGEKRVTSTALTASSPAAGAGASRTAMATAWEQTQVPPSYTEAYNNWAAATLAPLVKREVSATAAAAETEQSTMVARTSLWPSPSEVKQHLQPQPRPTPSRRDNSHNAGGRASDSSPSIQSNTAAAADGHMTPVRVFLRVEELAELTCAHCGAEGHTWQHCAARAADALTALEDVTAVRRLPLLPSAAPTVPDATSAASPAVPGSTARGTSVMEEEGLTSVEDAAAALAEHARSSAHRREQRARALATFGDPERDATASAFGDSVIVPVPNVAATQQFKARHVLRSEARKPAMHRRTVRCVYCGGHHHVTACPKLQAQDDASVMDRDAQAYEHAAAHHSSEGGSSNAGQHLLPLFCIKCGERGHLFRDCPQVPGDLHPATHCPICRQPRTKSSHDPLHCPRRAQVPPGYALTGIPLLDSNKTGGAFGRRGERRSAPSSSGFAHPRRRRGSVLIADSFVDAPPRQK